MTTTPKTIGSESIFLQAFEGMNKVTPVWFMRQAGRFLPEYQEIRKRYSLDQMFTLPDVAAEVTCLPVNLLGVDAAILFADILTMPQNIGFDIHFEQSRGPVINNSFTGENNLNSLHHMIDIPHVRLTIDLIKQQLPSSVPLIGFAGSPFTVLCYLVEGGSSINYRKVFQLMRKNPEVFHQFMRILTENTVAYFDLQKNAGIDAFQLFDSWGGILDGRDYREFVKPYVQQIFNAVDIPSIYYLKNSAHLLGDMIESGADIISVCSTVDFESDQVLEASGAGVQGNLHNSFLYGDLKRLETEVSRILTASQKYKKFIFNLNHGILPDTPVEPVKRVIELVHKHPRCS